MSRSKQKPVKTQSQVLRIVLFKHWQKDDKGYKDFEEYYDMKMTQIIMHFEKTL